MSYSFYGMSLPASASDRFYLSIAKYKWSRLEHGQQANLRVIKRSARSLKHVHMKVGNFKCNKDFFFDAMSAYFEVYTTAALTK